MIFNDDVHINIYKDAYENDVKIPFDCKKFVRDNYSSRKCSWKYVQEWLCAPKVYHNWGGNMVCFVLEVTLSLCAHYEDDISPLCKWNKENCKMLI